MRRRQTTACLATATSASGVFGLLPGVVIAQEASRPIAESPLSAANVIETAVGLVVVLVVMLGLAWLYRRFVQAPGAAQGQIQVLGGVSLGTREKAVLLSVHGKRVLVGVAPGRVQALMTLGDETGAVESTDSSASEFERQLEQANRERTDRVGEAVT